ncbi:MAG: DUF1365 domain-containing protein [Betaproteobacteria bacterium]|nr:DUF1365 domain-containing protein [Betaproteobacteria bacterium]
MSGARILFGRVFHCRRRPARHVFAYPVFFLRVPLSDMAGAGRGVFSVDRWNLLSLMSRDHGPRDGTPLEPWVRARLAQAGLGRADGEILLQAFPRVLGYVFNPISLFYCHGRDGTLRAVLCEVSNTFGERHNYLLAHPDGRPIEPRDRLRADKVLHVSPFCEVEGHYRFRFAGDSARQFVQIDYHDRDGKLIVTAIEGEARPVDAAALARAFFGYPLMTAGVVARIHWQALRLWLKRVPWFSKPEPPTQETTR